MNNSPLLSNGADQLVPVQNEVRDWHDLKWVEKQDELIQSFARKYWQYEANQQFAQERGSRSLTIWDFCPLNTWTVQTHPPEILLKHPQHPEDPKYPTILCTICYEDGTPLYLVDSKTDGIYWNETKAVVRLKCLGLFIGVPILHSLSILYFSACAIQSFFVHPSTEKLQEIAKFIFLGPVAIVALEVAALYGLFRPYDGRKIYASIEKLLYGHGMWAPCFQENPAGHLLGGDITKRNTC